jgi:hypothetical protein
MDGRRSAKTGALGSIRDRSTSADWSAKGDQCTTAGLVPIVAPPENHRGRNRRIHQSASTISWDRPDRGTQAARRDLGCSNAQAAFDAYCS